MPERPDGGLCTNQSCPLLLTDRVQSARRLSPVVCAPRSAWQQPVNAGPLAGNDMPARVMRAFPSICQSAQNAWITERRKKAKAVPAWRGIDRRRPQAIAEGQLRPDRKASRGWVSSRSSNQTLTPLAESRRAAFRLGLALRVPLPRSTSVKAAKSQEV